MIMGWRKRAFLVHLKYRMRSIPYYGNRLFCPVCGMKARKFMNFGVVERTDAQCPRCGSLERHRLLWLYLMRHTPLFDEPSPQGPSRKILHVAPEPCFEPRLRKMFGNGYLSADLDGSRAMEKMDITSIGYPDGSFDTIFCSHVLEHVGDDRKAIGELCRVLKKGGWAILMVPVTADRTFEYPSVTDPAERLRLFGQEDHLRRYGPDYADRLRDACFEVRTAGAGEIASAGEAARMGFAGIADNVYHCVKTD